MMNERCAKDLDLPNSEYDRVVYAGSRIILDVWWCKIWNRGRNDQVPKWLEFLLKGRDRVYMCSSLLNKNPGRFAPITCSPWVDSPPINCYYIIIDEVFFGNFCEIIYLLVVHTKKIIIHSFWSTFVKDLKWNFSCKIYKNNTPRTVKRLCFFFVPMQKCMKWLRCCTSAQITNYASNA